MRKKIWMFGLLCMLTMGLYGCGSDENTTQNVTTGTSEVTTQEESSTQGTSTESESGTMVNNDGAINVDPNTDPTLLDPVVLDSMTSLILNNMTLEQKVGQMFIANIELLDSAEPESYEYYKITKKMKKSMNDYKVGGVIFFARNIKTRKQTTAFINNLQKTSEVPMFISVDEEGGSVSRIGKNKKMGITKFPPMREIGDSNDKTKAFEVGDTIGREIKELGFNLDFAPIADVDTNPDSPEIGDRSFSSDPDIAADMVVECVKGLQGNGVSATLKHFPGHGSATSDTHKGYADINQSIKQLRKVEFVPFKAGIAAGVDLVMVSHLAITNVTGEPVPASLSSLMITDILRNELGFQNLVITDALNMKAITDIYSPEEVAVKAVEAGADILLMPQDLSEAYDGIMDAITSEQITEDRINDSVARIIRIKLLRGVIPLDTPLLTDQSTENG